MEQARKKAKITDHFRVALKPHNVNVPIKSTTNKKSHHNNQEVVEIPKKKVPLVITLDDDDDENLHELQLRQDDTRSTQPLPSPQQLKLSLSPSSSTNTSSSFTSSPFHSHHHPKHTNIYFTPLGIKPTVVDHDRFLLDDICCEPHYAWDSFNYDREQEIKFRNRKYFDDNINPQTRARLVDWMVQLQDNFSLYHEALYMAVKLADQYLMRKSVSRQKLQLLYTTVILVAVKFDERLPPLEISDLLRQSGNIYTREQVFKFELDLLNTLDFNIRYPLSYGFLRRFARCTGSDTKTLTLARYILESSLLDDQMIEVLESKVAAASLLLAQRMQHLDKKWDDTAEFYTRYTQEELITLTKRLNTNLFRPVDKRASTIRRKYTHEIFLSVAKIPPL